MAEACKCPGLALNSRVSTPIVRGTCGESVGCPDGQNWVLTCNRRARVKGSGQRFMESWDSERI